MTSSFLAIESVAAELENFIQHTVPHAVPVKKYGGTLYTVLPDEKEGQFCGVFIYKNHAQISFSNGALLKDPKTMLLGSGKYRRHINFTDTEGVDFNYLAKLLQGAVQF